MKVTTERIEDHSARLIVEMTLADLDKAKKDAAMKLSGRYKIPGFRAGKAPFNIVQKFLGESVILEEAVELLGNGLYPKALAESGLRPYAPGVMEDFKLDPEPVYTFTLALQAEAQVGDYRAVRIDYVQPEVTDETLAHTLEALRQQEALTEDIEGEIEGGHRVTVDLHSHFEDGEERQAEDAEKVTDDEEDDDDNVEYYKGDEYLHRHDMAINLNTDDEPVVPGFMDHLIGKKAGEVVEFDVTIPVDSEDHQNIAGRTIHFEVTIKKVQKVEVPTLDDAFAQKLTANEEMPLDLAQLTDRVRDNLSREAQSEYDGQYSDMVLDKILETATLSYPSAMVEERVKEMIENFKDRLKQQGITFDVYKSVTGIGEDKLALQYHDDADAYVRRSLVLGEVLVSEKVLVTTADVDAEVDLMVGQFGGDATRVRSMLNTREQRENIANRVLFARLMQRLTQIGKGEADALPIQTAEAVLAEAVSE